MHVRVEIAKHRFTVNFVILSRCAHNVILGMSFLIENRVIIDLHEGMISLWSVCLRNPRKVMPIQSQFVWHLIMLRCPLDWLCWSQGQH